MVSRETQRTFKNMILFFNFKILTFWKEEKVRKCVIEASEIKVMYY